jgi:hypothetical protein
MIRAVILFILFLASTLAYCGRFYGDVENYSTQNAREVLRNAPYYGQSDSIRGYQDPLRMWVYIQKEDQQQLAQELYEDVREAVYPRRVLFESTMDEEPPEAYNLLRYSDSSETPEIREIYYVLRRRIADLKIERADLRSWSKPGLIELWLSPHSEHGR